MAMKYSCRRIFGIAVLAVTFLPTVMAATPQPLRIVELFTSHGCSSCPPADRLLGKLLEEDPALMALEYHVDYWNSLVHGGAGSWTDPFSSREFTNRQRDYSEAELAGRRGVYTPQVVVNGYFAAVGSDRRRLQQALEQAGNQQLDIDIVEVPASDGRELNIRVSGSPAQLQQPLSLVGKTRTWSWLTTISCSKSPGWVKWMHKAGLTWQRRCRYGEKVVLCWCRKVQFLPFTRQPSAPELGHIFRLVIVRETQVTCLT